VKKTITTLFVIAAIVAIYTSIFNQSELEAVDPVSVSQIRVGSESSNEKTEAKTTGTGLVSFRVREVTVNTTGKNPKG